MDRLTALLSSDLWVRWRLAGNRGHVSLLGFGETLRAEGHLVDVEHSRGVEHPRSKLGMVAKAVLDQFGDWWSRGGDWDFREPGGGEALFAVRWRASHDDPKVFTVTDAENGAIGTVSAHLSKFTRELRLASGALCTYVPIPPNYYGSSRATIADGDRILATVFHDRDPDAITAVIPNSGMISPLDFGVTFASATDVPTRLLALVAAILDTKVHESPGDYERVPRAMPRSYPAPGTDARSAREQEAKEHRNDRLDRFQAKARRAGKDELADEVEKRRRDS